MNKIALSDNDIKTIVFKLEQKELKISSHLYKRYKGKMIGEASDSFSNEYSNEARERPGLILLSVILAAHRNYTKQVEPQIDRIRKMNFRSFEDLKQNTKSFECFSFLCGIRDKRKYEIIIELLKAIDKLKEQSGIGNDYNVMAKWAIKANYYNYREDIIGRISGIGVATFQHLRMNFGANTVKPDQRVKEVLNQEFKLYAKEDIEYISAVEYIAKIIGKSALYVDQVFVNYGSGYYENKNSSENQQLKDEKMQMKPVKAESREIKPEKNNIDGNRVDDMLEYINAVVQELDVTIKKRGDGGYIAVANRLIYLSKGKNIFTYWTTSVSISVIVLGLLPRKTFHSVEEMKNSKVSEKIRSKYNQTVNV